MREHWEDGVNKQTVHEATSIVAVRLGGDRAMTSACMSDAIYETDRCDVAAVVAEDEPCETWYGSRQLSIEADSLSSIDDATRPVADQRQCIRGE